MDDTTQALHWARNAASQNEIVAMFWLKLCESVREPATASVERVHAELCRYGGNTIANVFRGDGAPYGEVAYDVAEALRPWLGDRAYNQDDAVSCESFVLEKLEVKDNDLQRLCDGVKAQGVDKALANQLANATTFGAAEGAALAAARHLAKRAATNAAERALAEAGRQVAKRAAQKAAEQAAREVAKQVLIRVMAGVNILMAAWTVVGIAGPAVRVTIPGVAYVALLRKIFRAGQVQL